jgi:hypothetical protein
VQKRTFAVGYGGLIHMEAAVRELSVVGVRVELPSNQPIVLLREVDGDRYLPIWIGPSRRPRSPTSNRA